MSTAVAELAGAVHEISAQWRAARPERQSRRHLDRTDFDLLRDAGLLAAAAPVEAGGLWESAEVSTRWMCGLYRMLASADPSVALVSSMHPSVIAFWLAIPDP